MTPASLDIQASEIPGSPSPQLHVHQNNGTHAWTVFLSIAENLLLVTLPKKSHKKAHIDRNWLIIFSLLCFPNGLK